MIGPARARVNDDFGACSSVSEPANGWSATRTLILAKPISPAFSPTGGRPVANSGSRSAVLLWLNAKPVIDGLL